jgi:hypothetical protein
LTTVIAAVLLLTAPSTEFLTGGFTKAIFAIVRRLGIRFCAETFPATQKRTEKMAKLRQQTCAARHPQNFSV